MIQKEYDIQVFNNISRQGLERFPAQFYNAGSECQNPDAILLRSQNLHSWQPQSQLKAVGRAGAGFNNIPVDKLSDLGIPVFNTPGANANAVKELVVAGLLMACRNLAEAWQYTNALTGSEDEISQLVETGKKQFSGTELPGKTLGVIGLGAIGRSVAETCLQLGMNVIGYDPMLTVEGAWNLDSRVKRATKVNDLLRESDYITFHVPLNDATRSLISSESLRVLKPGVTILNFARSEIVDTNAVLAGLEHGLVRKFVTDFPSAELIAHQRVVNLPHLGASTVEAEENCARMVVDQVRDYLENGNVHNSVNFPDVVMPRGSPFRLIVANRNVPNMLGQISTTMAEAGLNIHDMINQSRGDLAYTVTDAGSEIPQAVVEKISSLDGVLNARLV
ncbi:MAG: D-3-phosphoglycerate dehydrogenase [Parasphingorhabdus sp.]|jgi:D-3-phosphoglycerate dehydrogenase